MQTAPKPAVDVSSVIDATEHFPAPALRQNSGVSLTDESAMNAMYRFAETMASGRATVPQHLQGNVGDCMAVALQAQRWGMSPFVVAQKTHLVNGQLGYEAQLVTAVVNTSSALAGRLKYRWFGDWHKIVGKFKWVESKTQKDKHGHPSKYAVPDWDPTRDEEGLGVVVSGTLRGETEPRELEILMLQARTRNSTLWAEDPKQQIAYLASKRWSRLYLPEVLLGVYDPDEFASSSTYMGAADVVHQQAPKELLEAARAAADKGRDAFAAWWKDRLPTERGALRSEMDDLARRTSEADAKRTVDNAAQAAAAAAPATDAPVKARAKAPAPAPKPTTAAAPSTGAPVFTAEKVRERLLAATDLDGVYIAADLINQIADDGARAALEALFDERKAAFE